MAELIYPDGGQAIISQFKLNLISDGQVGSKFDMSGGFNTNHPAVEQYNRTTFFTRYVPQNGFKFNSGVRLSEMKKVEIALGYDDSDSLKLTFDRLLTNQVMFQLSFPVLDATMKKTVRWLSI